MRESGAFLRGNFPHRDVREHLAAGAGDLSEILVRVGGGVVPAEVFRFRDELLPEPFRRNSAIIGMVDELIRRGDCDLCVYPVALGLRRVIGVEHREFTAAAQQRLIYRAYLLNPRELVSLLVPDVLYVPLVHLGGFELLRLVRAPEQYPLSGGSVHKLQRRQLSLPEMRNAELVYRPEELLVYAVLEVQPDFADNYGVRLRVLHHAEGYFRADKRGLRGASAAFEPVVGVQSGGDIAVYGIKRRRDDIRQISHLGYRPRSGLRRCRKRSPCR